MNILPLRLPARPTGTNTKSRVALPGRSAVQPSGIPFQEHVQVLKEDCEVLQSGEFCT